MGVSIGPRMEICETSMFSIPMVPCLHQGNGYIKRKLRVSRGQKRNALVGAETVLTSVEPQTTPFHGSQYRACVLVSDISQKWYEVLISC